MEDQHMDLPPGFRFHPTDEELITHYLSQKVLNSFFCARAIGEVDLNKCEPWDLPWRAKMGEKEWYFFCVRDRKYPTGLRTNRATDAGYWKATGKDKEIYKAKSLVGMKKTLVFYKGRAPRGEKSNWVMHEYRLEGKYSYSFPKSAKIEWVICRIFQKTAGGKKTHISGMIRTNGYNPLLPPLMDSSSTSSSITCFNPMDYLIPQQDMGTTPWIISYPSSSSISPSVNPIVLSKAPVSLEKAGFVTEGSGLVEEMNTSVGINHGMDQTRLDDQMKMVTSGGALDLDCLWGY